MFYYKTRVYNLIMVLSFSLFLFGCGAEEGTVEQESLSTKSVDISDSTESDSTVSDSVVSDSVVSESAPQDYQEKSQITSDSQKNINEKPLPNDFIKSTEMIYHASISMSVADQNSVLDSIEKNAKADGAYLTESVENQSEQEQTATVTYRVPKEKFHSFVEETKKLAKDHPEVHIQGDDVTEELVDLESRLKGKQTMEKRLLDMMNKSTQPADLLNIARQLDTTQGEMEQIKGRLQYLQNRVDYSTVEITISQSIRITPTSNQSVVSQIWESFITSIIDLSVLFIGTLVVVAGTIPFLIVLGILYLLIRFFVIWRRKRKNNQGE